MRIRRQLTTFIGLIAHLPIMARDYSGHRYFGDDDIGLPSGSEVGIGIVIALIAIPVGYMILKMSETKNGESNSFGGCFALLCIGGGIISLLPLFAWLCAISSVIYGIAIVLFIIIAIIAFLFSKNK